MCLCIRKSCFSDGACNSACFIQGQRVMKWRVKLDSLQKKATRACSINLFLENLCTRPFHLKSFTILAYRYTNFTLSGFNLVTFMVIFILHTLMMVVKCKNNHEHQFKPVSDSPVSYISLPIKPP